VRVVLSTFRSTSSHSFPPLSLTSQCVFTTLERDFMHLGWLFLFAVLMAAALLFTMVFFVRALSQSCLFSQEKSTCYFLFFLCLYIVLMVLLTVFICPLHRSHRPRTLFSPHASSYLHLNLQIIMFSDLECDYINPIDLCNKLNQVRPYN
jgi:peptidoglycan biosynthesis protein MviN/MurJ (putative lipid II flippase)